MRTKPIDGMLPIGTYLHGFHPKTLGVIHPCTIVGYSNNGELYRVYFPINGKRYWIRPTDVFTEA